MTYETLKLEVDGTSGHRCLFSAAVSFGGFPQNRGIFNFYPIYFYGLCNYVVTTQQTIARGWGGNVSED